jgi:uncharacterized membrane protein YdjX (TVP38/TMEM64 family)
MPPSGMERSRIVVATGILQSVRRRRRRIPPVCFKGGIALVVIIDAAAPRHDQQHFRQFVHPFLVREQIVHPIVVIVVVVVVIIPFCASICRGTGRSQQQLIALVRS